MGEILVSSRAVDRFKFSRFDKFEARNRPHLHIHVRHREFITIKWLPNKPRIALRT